MDLTTVILPNCARVFIIENVLNIDQLALVHKIADSFSTTNSLWSRATTTDTQPRWHYAVNDASFDPVRAAFSNKQHLSTWQQLLAPNSATDLYVSNMSFFVDLPGCTPLAPHVEGSDSWLSQVYIAQESHAYNGTTVYNADKHILFQLPFRDNAGWLFDRGSTVMHGREHAVPAGLSRFSLMIWYALYPE